MTYRWRRIASGWRLLLNAVHWKPNIAILGYSLVLAVCTSTQDSRPKNKFFLRRTGDALHLSADRAGLRFLVLSDCSRIMVPEKVGCSW
ncbi:hypothetical protein BDV36DRAFT_236615 [Aspergillus pseudocaelatus]|uniref:Secreted protein n=1 Tax=Aspergillus pseudocaelatus TaxID=1825620 RepID=A0ABQ6WCD4_9EURO|nr:hypothetical protein BDV36DRAFT_236615 [Aspergillus pseudocaelatus]